jgi:hypothetical protein
MAIIPSLCQLYVYARIIISFKQKGHYNMNNVFNKAYLYMYLGHQTGIDEISSDLALSYHKCLVPHLLTKKVLLFHLLFRQGKSL